MWRFGWRDQIWSSFDQTWDLIIIGGGITGAGIFREAVRAGLQPLLVEAHDFASGTSSRSSKLVHGGFRYLGNAQLKITLQSVRERERLLREGRGLINQLGFLLTSFRGDHFPTWIFGIGLSIYDLLALKWNHRYYDAEGILNLCPYLCNEKIVGGYRYFDAQTDDARLVLRLIREAVQDGGIAVNYTHVKGLLRDRSGNVQGVILQDSSTEASSRSAEVRAPVVINATGAWSDEIRAYALDQKEIHQKPRLRKLRGSHLVFASHKLPLARAISLFHPEDGRPVFAFPWEGVTIFGTTDVDQGPQAPVDPVISAAEVEYLMVALQHAFPQVPLKTSDVQCTFSGIRSVVDTGKSDPSKESREHVLWFENGLLTVTGGKLTTFRLMAHEALKRVQHYLPGEPAFDANQPVLDPFPGQSLIDACIDGGVRLRLAGRYGREAPELINTIPAEELIPIGDTPTQWAELRWAARTEGVVHLDDLLLRRVRIGLTGPQGALPWIKRIRAIVQPELQWDDVRWDLELERYKNLWMRSYSLK